MILTPVRSLAAGTVDVMSLQLGAKEIGVTLSRSEAQSILRRMVTLIGGSINHGSFFSALKLDAELVSRPRPDQRPPFHSRSGGEEPEFEEGEDEEYKGGAGERRRQRRGEREREQEQPTGRQAGRKAGQQSEDQLEVGAMVILPFGSLCSFLASLTSKITQPAFRCSVTLESSFCRAYLT